MMFATTYLAETITAIDGISPVDIENVVGKIAEVKAARGRIFAVGVGGSATTASHMVNDLRKINNIEAYAPTDNVAELTARINDDGWDSTFVNWLKTSRINGHDGLLVLSVGGGGDRLSPNIVKAVDYAESCAARIVGIVGKDGGYTATRADACVIIPIVRHERITGHTEGLASVICHLIVNHPRLR